MRFWFHYNKPASKKKKSARWSVHFREVCHEVGKIACFVPTHSRARNRQPFAVMIGFAAEITIKNDQAVIT